MSPAAEARVIRRSLKNLRLDLGSLEASSRPPASSRRRGDRGCIPLRTGRGDDRPNHAHRMGVRKRAGVHECGSQSIPHHPAGARVVGCRVGGRSVLPTVITEPHRSWRIQTSRDVPSWTQLGKVTNFNARFDQATAETGGVLYRFHCVNG